MSEGDRNSPARSCPGERRDFGGTSPAPRSPASADPATPGGATPDAGRRQAIRIGLCGGVAALVPAPPGRLQAASEVQPGDELVVARGDSAGKPIRVKDLEPLRAVLARPKDAAGEIKPGNTNLIVVVKVPAGELSSAAKDLAAGNVVAHSAICTHQGCFVNRVGKLGAGKGKLTCQCHGSIFEPRNAGEQVGGPAPRDLPALPVRAKNGRLVVAGTFTGPIGPA